MARAVRRARDCLTVLFIHTDYTIRQLDHSGPLRGPLISAEEA
jgi:hypothetical protein